MTKFDEDYLELCKEIVDKGVEVKTRTGVNALKIPSYNFEFDLEKEFPILQSKQTFYKNAIIEMLWIWQMQSNDVRLLHDRGVHIWDKWMIDSDGIYRVYDNTDSVYDPDREVVVMDFSDCNTSNNNIRLKLDDNGKVLKAKSKIPGKNILTAKYYGDNYAYTIGTAYGYIVKRFHHTQNLDSMLRKNKDDRRMVKSLWQDDYIKTAVLPPCVWATEWDVTDDRLNLLVHQRSCDVPLGLPFNVTQYAAFLKMMAQTTELIPGKISYSIKDAHIYIDQLKGIKEQLCRWNKYNWVNSFSDSEKKSRYEYLGLILNSENCVMSNEERKKYKEEYDMLEIILGKEKPELWVNPEIKNFFDFDNSRELKDVKVKKYKHLGRIDFPLSQ